MYSGTIKAGYDLDKAVAAALGGIGEPSKFDFRRMIWAEGRNKGLPFRPSEDLNDAFAAAKEVEGWGETEVTEDSTGCVAMIVGAKRAAQGVGPTAALAICASILELSCTQEQ